MEERLAGAWRGRMGHEVARSDDRRRAVAAPCVLALDIGSSSVRAALYDAAGRVVPRTVARSPYEFRTTPDSGIEADAVQTLDRVIEVVDLALGAAGALAPAIVAAGVSTYWHNVLGVDGEGRPLTPVFTWADTRAAGAADELARELDPAEVHARTGCVLHPSYLPAKLRWFARHDPATFGQVVRWLSVGEWLLLQFTGRRACSLSMASGSGLLHQAEGDWDGVMVEAAGIRREQLLPIIDASEPVGVLTEHWTARWPALNGVPWFPALGDGACANVGSGCMSPERVALSLGTSGAMRVMVDEAKPRSFPGLWTYRLDRRRCLYGGALSNGGNLHAWLGDTLRIESVDECDFGEPDGHGLTVLPFLAGERSPNWNPRARGAILGLTLRTTPSDIVQAGLEAVAYRFGLIHELLRPVMAGQRLIVASGAAVAHSAAWGQLLADTFGESVEAAAETEASSRGAALMALTAIGATSDPGALPPPGRLRWEPDARRHAIYRAAAERQRRDYDRLFGR